MQPLAECCQREADRHLRKQRKVARCDRCGNLVLSYGTIDDYEQTIAELEDNDVDFQVGQRGPLRIIAYQR